MLTTKNILAYRLRNQLLIDTSLENPEQVVSHLVAMQAQEFAMAKWAIHLRTKNCQEAAIQKAFDDGSILRTHLMRPTWHFVAPADIRWMLELTVPRVHAINAFMYRQTGLNKKSLNRSNTIIARAFDEDKYLTRDELKLILAKNKIKADGPRLACIMMYAELEKIICSGPRKGKKFTYALLEDRVPASKDLTRKEALNLLVSRYFATRGPATLKDFTTWSGLSMPDAKTAASDLPADFVKEKMNGHEYIFQPPVKKMTTTFPTFLMADYDEYGMGYKDRSALFPEVVKKTKAMFNHVLIVDGQIGGSWLRTVKNNKVSVETHSPLKNSQVKKIGAAIKDYLSFSNQTNQPL